MKKIIFYIILALVLLLLGASFFYFFIGKAKEAKNITWGIDFSQMQAEALKLNWKEVYLAIINDLGTKNIKLHTQWDWVEGKKGELYFGDIDWQIAQAEKNDVKIIYVVGIKTGRWPECHMPEWANSLAKEDAQQKTLDYIKEVVLRYKDSKAIKYWQIENEPLFKFGNCPAWYYDGGKFLKQEVALVKSLDPSRKIIISDSGELSFWFGPASVGDIVGTTMYRRAWVNMSSFGILGIFPGFYGTYPIPPVTYWRKAEIIKKIFNKDTICIELQAEPWAPRVFYDVPLEEQEKTMNLEMFKGNVEYAKNSGFDTIYFWGAEWWYWMKTRQNQPEIWNTAKELF